LNAKLLANVKQFGRAFSHDVYAEQFLESGSKLISAAVVCRNLAAAISLKKAMPLHRARLPR